MAVEAAEDGCVVNHEAEYMAAVEAGKEILWMKEFIGELGIRQELYCDSQSAIHLAKNAAYQSRTKHIQLRYHCIRERVENQEFALMKKKSEVLSHFQKLKNQVKKETGQHIRCLRSDGGKEYFSNKSCPISKVRE